MVNTTKLWWLNIAYSITGFRLVLIVHNYLV
jgi:hypothetical protein